MGWVAGIEENQSFPLQMNLSHQKAKLPGFVLCPLLIRFLCKSVGKVTCRDSKELLRIQVLGMDYFVLPLTGSVTKAHYSIIFAPILIERGIIVSSTL